MGGYVGSKQASKLSTIQTVCLFFVSTTVHNFKLEPRYPSTSDIHKTILCLFFLTNVLRKLRSTVSMCLRTYYYVRLREHESKCKQHMLAYASMSVAAITRVGYSPLSKSYDHFDLDGNRKSLVASVCSSVFSYL